MSAYVWPCAGGYVSSKFGPRKAPTKGASTYHYGIDIAAAAGTSILAARPGKVIFRGYNSARGNYLKVDHGGGVVTLYQHSKQILVSVGAVVQAGQKIALVGSTGISTGPHLHFEVQVGGVCKNPLNYVSPGATAYTGPAYGASGSAAAGGGTSADAAGGAEASTRKEITAVVSKSITGTAAAQKNLVTGLPAYLSQGAEILIQNDQVYLPVVIEGIDLEQSRKGAPSKLTFSVMKDAVLNIQEGNPVTLRFNGTPMFAGFLFKKQRSDGRQIKLTCYDQLRYLKNKDTLSYTNKTYAEVLTMIAADYHLVCGSVADTKYKIPSRIEEGTLLDMLQNASDLTVLNTGTLYILYDEFGKLTLKPLADMRLDLVVDEDTGESYDYTSSIDGDTYNKIKLAVDNSETGERETYVLNEPENQARWGQLQYYEKLDADTSDTVLAEKAKVLLQYYNKKTRSLQIKGVFGDVRVRGGSLLVIKMGLGDMDVQNYMCVEKVLHQFYNGLHTMDLTLSGVKGEFQA